MMAERLNKMFNCSDQNVTFNDTITQKERGHFNG